MEKWMLCAILLLTFQAASSQDKPADNRIKSITSLYYPVDTVQSKGDKYSLTVDFKWMGSIIQVRRTTRIKYDLAETRKFRRDSTYIPTPADTLRYTEMRKIFSQNCHSYALEKYFKNERIADDFLFTEWTTLTENQYMEKILITSFERIKAFEPKKKKCKDCNFTEGSIIVFRNKWGTPIHTVYYDGKFQTKNGGGAAKTEDHVDGILKTYWDSTQIEEYRLDDKKIADYLSKRG